MSAACTELCCLLVEDVFGEVCADVVRELLLSGRQSVAGLVQRTPYVPATIKQALVALTQHGLVLFWEGSTADPQKVCHYECSEFQVQQILRYGQFVQIAERKWSAGAAVAVDYLLVHGRATVGDVVEAVASENVKGSAGGLGNGVHEQDAYEVVSHILKDRILLMVHAHQLHPKSDLRASAIATELFKQRSEVKSSVAKMNKANGAGLSRELEAEALDGLELKLEPLNESPGPKRKRRKIENADETEVVRVHEASIVRLNFARCLTAIRNEAVVKLVEERVATDTAKMYRHILDSHEARVYGTKPLERITFTAVDAARTLPPDLDLKETFAARVVNGWNHGDSEGSIAMPNGVNTYAGEVSNSVRQVSRQLNRLADEAVSFVQKFGEKGGGEYCIDYVELRNQLRLLHFQKLVSQRYGDRATRLLRIVMEKKKIEEKQLAAIALMRQRDIRADLMALHDGGILELQEVPRSADRAPSRTTFLWTFSGERAIPHLLKDIYMAMTRVLQRCDVERSAHGTVIDRLESMGSRKEPEQALNSGEKRELTRLKRYEETLQIQLWKLDTSALIFGEF